MRWAVNRECCPISDGGVTRRQFTTDHQLVSTLLRHFLQRALHAGDYEGPTMEELAMMLLVLIVLAILLFGGGFALNILWYAAVIVLVLAAVSYLTGRRGSRA